MTILPEDLSYECLLSGTRKLVSCLQQAKEKHDNNKTTMSGKFWFANFMKYIIQ